MVDASATGSDGCVLQLRECHGIAIHPLLSDDGRIAEIQRMQARDDDILICGYPKCGTNWVWEVVKMLLNNATDYIKTAKAAQMLEFSLAPMSVMVKEPSPRVLNTHLPFSYLPTDSIKRRNKIIYLVRNHKDVAVSYFNHTRNLKMYEYEGSWNAYFEIFVEGRGEYGSYYKYLKQWEQDIKDHPETPVITLHYEDLKQDFTKEIRRMCDFLEISREETFLEAVREACTFKKMKDAKHTGMMKDIFREGESMYRKGGVGDWKNWFTVAQSEIADKIYEEETKGLDIKFKYVL